MNTILVTATEESTGKTAITLGLGLLAREHGHSVGYMKPKGTRLQSNVGKTLDRDPMLARELLDLDDEMHEMEPVVYSPTFVREAIRGGERPDAIRESVREGFEAVSEGRDTVLLEGGGSIATGGIVDLADPDVAELLDARVVLVASYGTAGDVDELLAAADALDDRLEGVVFNRVADAVYDEVEGDVATFLERRGIPVLGVLPRRSELAGVTVADLAGELGAELLTDVSTDGIVERFLVGAMGGDQALRYFRRTKDAAVITGGDRADIHTAAIEAPGVKCLLLTGGQQPTPAVLGSAEQSGLPILSIGSDTLTAIDRAEEIVRSGRTRDEHTVNLMRDLLFEHADVEEILERSGGAR